MTEEVKKLIKKPIVVCDQREKGGVAKILDLMGADVQIRILEVGDYVVSDRIGFERKNEKDFKKSLFEDKTLFGQVKDLSNAYERPILIVEGVGIFNCGATPQSIQAVLNSIAIDFGVATLYTADAQETAKLLYNTAMREQFGISRPIQLHGNRSHLSLAGQQEYIVSGIPDIGRKTAHDLLLHFGSVQAIFSANSEELMMIKGVKEKTATQIRKLAGSPYVSEVKNDLY